MSTEEQPGKVSDLLGYDNAAAAEAGVGLGVKSKRAAADAAGRRLKGRGAEVKGLAEALAAALPRRSVVHFSLCISIAEDK